MKVENADDVWMGEPAGTAAPAFENFDLRRPSGQALVQYFERHLDAELKVARKPHLPECTSPQKLNERKARKQYLILAQLDHFSFTRVRTIPRRG
jgi:hypothetical protein